MYNRFTNNAKRVLQYAQQTAQRLGHDYVGTEHILLGLVLNKDGVAGQVLAQLGLTPENVLRAIEKLTASSDIVQDDPGLTPRTKRTMELAVSEANRLGQNYVGTEHILAGLILEGSGRASQILESMDVDPEQILHRLADVMGTDAEDMPEENSASGSIDLNAYGRDLNELARKGKIDPVIGREKEIDRVIQILSRRTKITLF